MHEVITLIVLRRPILGQTICTTRHGKRNFSDKSHPKQYFSGNYKVLKNDILVDNQSVRVVWCDRCHRWRKKLIDVDEDWEAKSFPMGLCAQIYLNFFNCKSSQLQKASHLFTEIIFHICTLVFCPMSLCSFDATLVPSYLRVYIWPFSDPFILKSPLVNIRQSLTCPFAERQISVITNNCNIIIKQYPYPQYPKFDEIIIHNIF